MYECTDTALHFIAFIPDSVIFKSISFKDEDEYERITNIKDIANEILENHSEDSIEDQMTNFLASLSTSSNKASDLERRTRGQSDNEKWFLARQGRLTASKHHEIQAKINSISRAKGVVKPATTPVVSEIVDGGADLSLIPAIAWGKKHENDALKCFRLVEAVKHKEFHIQSLGLFVNRKKIYIAASPDGFFTCKCDDGHCPGKAVIEIKCPYKIRERNIHDGVLDCEFLELDDNSSIRLKKNHQYYTQVMSQMAQTLKSVSLSHGPP